MLQTKYRISFPLLLIWLLLGSLVFIALVSPERGLFTAAIATVVFGGLSGADKMHLI